MSFSWTAAEGWFLHQMVGGGLLLALTAGLMRWARHPEQRQRLAEAGLAAALMMAVLCLFPSWLVLAWPVQNEPMLPAPEPMREAVLSQDAEPSELDVGVDAALAGAVTGPDTQAAAGMPFVLAGIVANLPRGCLVLFSIGASWFLLRWLLGHVALWQLLRRSSPAPSAVAELFAAVTVGRRRVRLLVSQRLRVPVSCGLFRPTVLLPASLCEAGARATGDLQKLRWTFAHELTHLDRRDAWSSALFALGQAMYFYVPFFWWLRRQVRLCQEYIADAAAIRLTTPSPHSRRRDAADYAEFLLSLSKCPAVPVAATGVSGNTSDLFRRVSMLLQNPVRVERRRPGAVFLAGAALVAAAVLIAGIGVETSAAQVVIITGAGKVGDADSPVRVIVLDGQGQQKDKPRPADVPQLHQGGLIIKKVPGAQEDIIIKRVVVDRQPGAEAGRVYLFKPADLADKAKAKSFDIEIHLPQLPDVKKKVGTTWPALPPAHVAHGWKGRKALEKYGPQPSDADMKKLTEDLLKLLQHGRQGAAAVEVELHLPGVIDTKKPAPEAAPPAGAVVDAKTLLQLLDALEKQQGKDQDKLLHDLIQNLVKGSQKATLRTPGQPVEAWQHIYRTTSGPARLGIQVEKPSPLLVEQLDLPKGQGLVVTEVSKDSAAAKAGLKPNDILLQLNKQPVPSQVADFVKQLAAVQPNVAVDAVVVRKGKHETIKGITLPETKPRWQAIPGELGLDGARSWLAPGAGMVTTTQRTAAGFTTRHQEGSLSIQLSGTIKGGKTMVSDIRIRDGDKDLPAYQNVDNVPAQYRDRVNLLLQVSAISESKK